MKFISKKLLLVSLCLVVLLVAVGAYSYVTISRLNNHMSDLESQVDSLQNTVSSLEDERDSLQNNVSVLESQIEELQDEIDHLQNELSHMNNTKTFVFEWPSWEQTIVNGTLRMNITFAWKGENLSIIAKINDNEYDGWDYLALAFDITGNGIPNVGCKFYANDEINCGLLQGNDIQPLIPDPGPSTVHTCIFELGIGYTFNLLLPQVGEEPLTTLPTDSIFVRFQDSASHGIYLYFCFGLPLEPLEES